MIDRYEPPDDETKPNLNLLQKTLQEITQKYNSTPQQELGGLSPVQMYNLIHISWDDPNFPINFNQNLSDKQVYSSEFAHNARILLAAGRDEKGLPCTPKGNFKRVIVKRFLDEMRWQNDYINNIHQYNKVINEQDVKKLHVLRVFLEVAELIRRRKNKWHVSSTGKQLINPGRGGEFYFYLFKQYFRQFNIEFFTVGREFPEIQDTVAYMLYRISRLKNNWYTRDEISQKITAPIVKKRIKDENGSEIFQFIISSRVLTPLNRFGLLNNKTSGKIRDKDYENFYKKTPLFNNFIRLNLPD